MKFIASISFGVVALLLSSYPFTGRAAAANVHCGTEGWAAKGLTDGSVIDFNTQTPTTVVALRALARPSGVDNKSAPRVEQEKHVYTIHALLQEYKIESDHDFHIVIADFGGSASKTMIAEIPDRQCDGVAGDGFTKQFASIRSAMESKFGTATGSMNVVNAEVSITGVLFFDFLHGQTGVAPNGVELHPVIAMSFGPGSGGVPTPSPVVTQSPGPSPTPGSTPTPGPTPASGPTPAPSGSPTSGAVAQFASAAAAQAHCPSDVVVWLNTRSGLYHLKGHRYYGTTSQGAYVCQKEAVQAGYSEGY